MAEMRISVIIDAEGRVGVEGPLGNKLLCYGLLQAGMDAVRNHKAGPTIQPVTGAAAGAVLGLVRDPRDAA